MGENKSKREQEARSGRTLWVNVKTGFSAEWDWHFEKRRNVI